MDSEMETSAVKKVNFPPEWHEQDGVMLTWPHDGTDWASILPEVEQTYLRIAREIIKREKLLLVCRKKEAIIRLFQPGELEKIHLFEMASDDTWSRDHGPITTLINQIPAIHDFTFNGWGGKFYAANDNGITRKLFQTGAFRPGSLYFQHDWVLEGGSIETDGEGTLLTTAPCLLNSNRNGEISTEQAEFVLKEYLGAKRILWLDHGHLEGDDTDSHIDTLARFCNRNTICYVSCSDLHDPHYLSLKKMEQQLQGFRTINGEPYRLVPLPMASPRYDIDGRRLPATYANFLIINQAVLMPVYQVPEDKVAVQVMQSLFPDREIVAIDCTSLIKQYGSLHCITMQIPKGFLP